MKITYITTESDSWPRIKPITNGKHPTLTRGCGLVKDRDRPGHHGHRAWQHRRRGQGDYPAPQAAGSSARTRSTSSALATKCGCPSCRAPRPDHASDQRHRHRPRGPQGQGRRHASVQTAGRVPRPHAHRHRRGHDEEGKGLKELAKEMTGYVEMGARGQDENRRCAHPRGCSAGQGRPPSHRARDSKLLLDANCAYRYDQVDSSPSQQGIRPLLV